MSALDAVLSGRKNRKARALVTSAEEMISGVDSEIEETDKVFEGDLNKYSSLREAVMQDSLKTFDDIYIAIENVDFKGAYVTHTDDALENIGEEFCNCKDDIEAVKIAKVKSGTFGAVVGGLFTGALALAGAVAVAVTQMGMQIDPKKVPTPEQINQVFEWFGKQVPLVANADALHNGMYLLGGGSALIAVLVGYLILNSKSTKNLAEAESTFAKAEAVHQEKINQNNKTMTMAQFIETLENNLKTLQIYMDEYNAVLKRIIHTEGTDFNAYGIASQESIQKALATYKTIKSLIGTKVVATDGAISDASRYEVEKSGDFLKTLLA